MTHESIVTPGKMLLSPSEMRAEIERLRAALERIVSEHDAMCAEMETTVEEHGAWAEGVFEGRGQAADIARAALSSTL